MGRPARNQKSLPKKSEHKMNQYTNTAYNDIGKELGNTLGYTSYPISAHIYAHKYAMQHDRQRFATISMMLEIGVLPERHRMGVPGVGINMGVPLRSAGGWSLATFDYGGGYTLFSAYIKQYERFRCIFGKKLIK